MADETIERQIESQQPDPAVDGTIATGTKRRELEASGSLLAELRKYWLSCWPFDPADQFPALELESEEHHPCDLLPVFLEYAEALFDARAPALLRSADSFEHYREGLEVSIGRGILNQLLPAESLIVPEPEPIDVRCIETKENLTKAHLCGRIIRFDRDLSVFCHFTSLPAVQEHPFSENAENRIIQMAESPSGDWEKMIALSYGPFKALRSGPKDWREACHPFQLTLRLSESRVSFIEVVEAHLKLRIPRWTAEFLQVKEAEGAAIAHENPLEFVRRRLGELRIEWKRVQSACYVSERTVTNLKRNLKNGRLRAKYVNGLAGLLQMNPQELLDVIKQYNASRKRR